MTGEKLKYEIKKRGYTLKSIAEKMNTSPQNLGGQLATENVSSGLIEKVADIMGLRVIDFYPGGDIISAADHSTAFKGSQSCDPRLLDIIQSRDRQFDKCQQQLQKSQEQIDRLIAIIEKN